MPSMNVLNISRLLGGVGYNADVMPSYRNERIITAASEQAEHIIGLKSSLAVRGLSLGLARVCGEKVVAFGFISTAAVLSTQRLDDQSCSVT